MPEYVGIAALKEALGMSGESSTDEDDGALRAAVTRASSLIDGHLQRVRPGYVGFAASSNTAAPSVGSNSRSYDGTGHDVLWIDDALSVSSVVVDSATVTATAYTLWPYNQRLKRAIRYNKPVSSVTGLTAGRWSPGTANVVVTGYWGEDHVPPDIEETALALAILLFRRYQSGDPSPGPVTALGGQGQVKFDPEVDGILEQLDRLWARYTVDGA